GQDEAVLATGKGELAARVALAGHDGQKVRLDLHAEDAAGEATRTLPILVETSARLRTIDRLPRGAGLLDVDERYTLVRQERQIRLFDRARNETRTLTG